MLEYVAKRLLWILPSIFILLSFTFVLSKLTDQDAVSIYLEQRGVDSATDPNFDDQYKAQYKELNLDKPWYYFSVIPHYYPDNIQSIVDEKKRSRASWLLSEGYDVQTIERFNDLLGEMPDSISAYNIFSKTPTELLEADFFREKDQLELQDIEVKKHQFFLPKLVFHGFNNQFHYWVSSLFKGEWGMSYVDGRPVLSKIKKAFSWTGMMLVINLLLVIFIGIPLVLYVVGNTGLGSQILEWIAVFFYVIPLFWLATLIQVFLTTPDYGLEIFSVGSNDVYARESSSLVAVLMTKYLPAVICLTLTDLAVLIRLMKGNVLMEKTKPYVLTALSKGMSKRNTVFKHVIPNTLIPLVTMVIGSIPAFFAGSLIIEVIFNIPGMGRLLYQSILQADWVIVYIVIVILGLLTMVVYLIGDVIYQWLDPKVSFDE